MLVFDTNVLCYAIDPGAEPHESCRRMLNEARTGPSPSYLTWNVCYEFMRVSTHPRVLPVPWRIEEAQAFLKILLDSPAISVLRPTERHQTILAQTIEEFPDTRGNFVYNMHTVVLMREHGVSRICTRDAGFHRFPFLTVVDPLR